MTDKPRKLESLISAADECYASCSDYSCVRRGECGGFAGHELRDMRYEQRKQAEQKKSDAALAAQIKRLKKVGAI